MIKIMIIIISKVTIVILRLLKKGYPTGSLSISPQHSANADVTADAKSKIIVSRRHFFADMFSAISKVQNYQNKTRENLLYLYPNNTCLLHISRNFEDIFTYIFFTLCL